MKKNRKRWYPEEGIPGKFLRKMKRFVNPIIMMG